jgi:hypothetical protein
MGDGGQMGQREFVVVAIVVLAIVVAAVFVAGVAHA